TKGRGFRGSHWASPNSGNIYFSAALPAEIFAPHPTGAFSQVFALKFIMKFGEMVNLSVKWPNDIFLAGKKVGGVLLETRFTGNVPKRAVFGVGINVSTAPDLSSGTAYGATALKIHSQSITYQFVLGAVVEAVEEAVDLCGCGKHSRFIADNWSFFDMFHGKRINVSCGGRIFSGNEAGVDADGSLILRLDTGELLHFNSVSAKIIL
ncbi:MAG: biotin--[acetyl-CoA-carboxylase] ligase, partial [Puniceicoccales bacterium]|nr:biotin--[acetyl-CoA-carboxylase] ligase [Puniceicoccales bacterium]